MINKYVAVIENEYDQYSVIEFVPFQTNYTPEEILEEQNRIISALNRAIDKKDGFNYSEFAEVKDYFAYCDSKRLPILDTGISLYSKNSPILYILTIDEWFTKYTNNQENDVKNV